jgi:DNA repair ATPase RecN
MFSCNAESRLHNLVQTINKYKHDTEGLQQSKDSMVQLYENFEKWQDEVNKSQGLIRSENEKDYYLKDDEVVHSNAESEHLNCSDKIRQEADDVPIESFDFSKGFINLKQEPSSLYQSRPGVEELAFHQTNEK